VEELLSEQSAEIGEAVRSARDDPEELGAGDQGIMVGYASSETPELMPLPILLAHRLTAALAEARRAGPAGWLRPDGKSQVTVRYRDARPLEGTAVVVSTQHDPGVDPGRIHEFVVEEMAPAEWLADLDFRPGAIIRRLDLRRPIYRRTACYGHFGREGFPWEA